MGFVLLGAAIVLFYAPAFWLLGCFIVLSACVGFADGGGALGAASSATFMFVVGVVVVAIRRSAKALWRGERDRWDSRDLPPDVQ